MASPRLGMSTLANDADNIHYGMVDSSSKAKAAGWLAFDFDFCPPQEK